MIQIPDFRGVLKRNFTLAHHTTWHVGGEAEVFAVPEDMDDLLCLLAAVKAQGVPLYVLGRGSNVLIDDAGLPGVTLQLGRGFEYLALEGNILRVGAGLPMPKLATRVAGLGFTGFEHLVGIPGTVGAGVVINAGAGGQDTRSILRAVTYIGANLQLVSESAESLDLGYRYSRLQGSKAIVVEAIFELKTRGKPSEIRAEMRRFITERRAKFPLDLPNAGSVFKRPANGAYAGQLIESAGLKGFRIGDAQVSQVHANFIVNLGQASSKDIKALIKVIYRRVLEVHGVVLEPEVVFWPEQYNW